MTVGPITPYRNHSITLSCRLEDNSWGADIPEALDDARLSDGLCQVDRLKIALTWTDPNAKTHVTTFRRLITIKSGASHYSFTGTRRSIVYEGFGTLKVRQVLSGSRGRKLSFNQLRHKQELNKFSLFSDTLGSLN